MHEIIKIITKTAFLDYQPQTQVLDPHTYTLHYYYVSQQKQSTPYCIVKTWGYQFIVQVIVLLTIQSQWF